MQKTALITGAGRGIGKSIALCLAQAGYDIAVNYATSSEGAEDTALQVRALGRKAHVYKADVQSVEQITKMFESVSHDFETLDLLVNNAGITRFASILTATEETWKSVMDTDLKGTYFCTQAAARLMVERQTKGTIINISSNHSKGAWPKAAIYAAAKAGVNKLTENLALELAPYGIRVVCIAPGFTWLDRYGEQSQSATAQKIAARIPAKRYASTREIGDAVVFMASESAGYITGTTLFIDGGALLPVVAENDYI